MIMKDSVSVHVLPCAPQRGVHFITASSGLRLDVLTVRDAMALGDGVAATALIDRLLHHCHIVDILGNNRGMREHGNLMRSASSQRRQGERLDWAI